jgi:hypothetical protein
VGPSEGIAEEDMAVMAARLRSVGALQILQWDKIEVEDSDVDDPDSG